MSEVLTSTFFSIFGIMATASALLVVTRKNPIYSALFLVVVFAAMAGQFFLLGAEFLGFMQLLVYAGAIMVLYLFVIMLINPQADRLPVEGGVMDRGIAAGVALLVFALLFTAIQQADFFYLKEQLPSAVPLLTSYQEEQQQIAAASGPELIQTYGLTEREADLGRSEVIRRDILARQALDVAFRRYRAEVIQLPVLFNELARARSGPAEPGSPEQIWADQGTVEAFGRVLFTDHLLVFELTSVLILIAIVGAVHFSLRPRLRSRPVKIFGRDDDESASRSEKETVGV